MASVGWQSEKTLAECMQHMLDNEIATDVCFKVGPQDGATVNIRAHKFMLISRCPVFEAMLSSKMSETKNETEAQIRIVDISAEVFKLLLSFIYCDTVSIDHRSAPTLLYAARKYLLPRLTECCSKYLQSIMGSNNVLKILGLSFVFEVEDLKSQCIEFVANNSETVLNRDELLTLSRESFEAILKVDRMMSGPSTLFNSCVKWAKHQLQENQSVEAPNDLQIRETLGSFLHEIPFPTISVTEFANLVGDGDILTAEEKSAIYYYLASRKGKDKLKFSTGNRHERMAYLATRVTKGLWPDSKCSSCGSLKKNSVEISFKTNKDILLTGIGLYKRHDGSDYAVDIQVIEIIEEEYSPLSKRPNLNLNPQTPRAALENQTHGANLFTGSKRIVPHSESSTTFKVYFDEPVSIAQGKLYKVSALADKEIGYYGELCRRMVVEDVTFTVASASSNSSGVCFGCFRCGAMSTTPTCTTCNASGDGLFYNNSAMLMYGQLFQLYFIPMLS